MEKLLIYTLLAMMAMGCMEVPVELPPKTVVTSGRVLLLEDLTGVDCGNCPGMAIKLEELVQESPDNVVVVGIHGKDLAAPISGSKYDFRNEDAAFIEEYLRPWLGKPAVSYNRHVFSDQQGSSGNLSLVGETQVRARTEELFEVPQTVAIESFYNWVDRDERTIEVFAGITALEDITGNFNVTVMITESHIIDAQLNALKGEIELDYEHNHVLRDIITANTGDQLSTSMSEGETINKSWVYTIPDDQEGLWVIENLEFVIFVADTEGDSKEVLQANKLKLSE